ncbi:hypothetical protein AURDEDRAFT_161730 [Auricularia subglabra TFB-10046 SS5]|nr:hypothetical protein AURDEDRAFT_161730 [Auricularia subglabra TFB-10046 SS5]
MLTANEHEAVARLPPKLAQSLEDATSALAENLTARGALSDDLEAHAKAMRTLVAQTIASSFRDWNVAHDRMRALPVELLSMCWSHLPQSDLVRLASVCSSWRSLSLSTPTLWMDLNVLRLPGDLPALLSRSAQLPLKLSLSLFGSRDLHDADESLRAHAHHIRELSVIFQGCRDWRLTGFELSFRFSAPALEKLSLAWKTEGTKMVISPHLFEEHAPRLHTVTLDGIDFPSSSCRIFCGITRLTMRFRPHALGEGQRSLLRIFAACPDLVELELGKLAQERYLPSIPVGSKLRRVALSFQAIDHLSTLVDRGYLGLPQLDVSMSHWSILGQVALHQAPGLHASVSVSHMEAVRVILHRPDGAAASFTARNSSNGSVHRLLRDGNFPGCIQRLVIPSTLTLSEPDADGTSAYHLIADELRLPSLRTLVVLHGPDGHCFLLDPDVVCGVIVAPLLSRVEILHDPVKGIRRAAGPIRPSGLVLFIEKHIECSNKAALELFVDSKRDSLLDCGDDDAMENLRSCVGKIVYG